MFKTNINFNKIFNDKDKFSETNLNKTLIILYDQIMDFQWERYLLYKNTKIEKYKNPPHIDIPFSTLSCLFKFIIKNNDENLANTLFEDPYKLIFYLHFISETEIIIKENFYSQSLLMESEIQWNYDRILTKIFQSDELKRINIYSDNEQKNFYKNNLLLEGKKNIIKRIIEKREMVEKIGFDVDTKILKNNIESYEKISKIRNFVSHPNSIFWKEKIDLKSFASSEEWNDSNYKKTLSSYREIYNKSKEYNFIIPQYMNKYIEEFIKDLFKTK